MGDCRAELCPNWPGEGCVRGVVDCPAGDDFYDDPVHVAEDDSQGFGPVFAATYEGEDSCCGEGIVPGEDIRADGDGGWIHADDQCERMVLPIRKAMDRAASSRTERLACPSCFLIHAGECL